MPGVATKSLRIYTPKPEAAATSQQLHEAAGEVNLTVDLLSGRRGPLGYHLDVTVTGEPEQIESFHRRFEGDGWATGGGSDIAGLLLNPVLDTLFGNSQRSIASRVRLKRLQRQARDTDPGT